MKIVTLSDIPDVPSIHNPEMTKRIILGTGDVPHIRSVGQVCFKPGQIIPIHAHAEMHEIFMIRSGSGVIRIDGKEHALTPGCCTVIEPNETHEVENTGSETMLLVYFQIPLPNASLPSV